MECPNCRHSNTGDAHFCTQCGATLANPSTPSPPIVTSTTPQASVAPMATPAGSHRTVPIVLGVIFGLLLLLVGGVY
ncbi:MAG: zinc ribbon domain-containing protein, partial [Rhodanobacter sp.]